MSYTYQELVNLLIITILVSHTGIAFTLLMRPGNILDWLAVRIERIRNEYLRQLLTCSKCLSGQVALWTLLGYAVLIDWKGLILGWMWVLLVIVLTDQLGRRYGYS